MKILIWLNKHIAIEQLFIIGGIVFFGIIFYSIVSINVNISQEPNTNYSTDCTTEKAIYQEEKDQLYELLLHTQIDLVRAQEELKIYRNLGEAQ